MRRRRRTQDATAALHHHDNRAPWHLDGWWFDDAELAEVAAMVDRADAQQRPATRRQPRTAAVPFKKR